MSFSSNVKEAICGDAIRGTCCKKAFLAGVLAARGRLEDEEVHIRIADKTVLHYVLSLVGEVYGKTAEVRPVPFGGRNRDLVFSAKSAARLLEAVEDGDAEQIMAGKCPSCKTRFLQGLFVSAGRVSDPAKQNFLEFSVDERADLIEEMLWSYDMHPRLYVRRNEKLLQMKDGESLEDFFGLLGMNHFFFMVTDTHMENMVKAEAQRNFNCDTMNIDRALSAAARQAKMIQKLKDKGLLDTISADLQTTALARLAHPDLPLSALAEVMEPPLKKSCLAQRLRKIEQLAKDLLEDA